MTDENELMMQVKTGQLQNLAILYENNKKRLFNFFRQMNNSPEVSEDLVQETFMRVLAYRNSFNNSSSFRTWLFSIARNTSTDYFHKNQHAQIHDEFDETNVESNMTLIDEIENEQKQTLFFKALQSIPADLREIIVLSRYQQIRYEDIAAMLNCNLNTLKSRMSQAIKQLKKSYQHLSNGNMRKNVVTKMVRK